MCVCVCVYGSGRIVSVDVDNRSACCVCRSVGRVPAVPSPHAHH